ncbi:hypothetical protein ACFOWE_15460 [Planomonospora corallina]|uniref:Uncharacterized protein n=1 Tax=Planomonospora corallina TaxID=1806052 RepID=A0ABV8I8L4_9ACTN
MRTELHTPPGADAPLAPLTERLAAMSAPCPMHPSVHRIEAALLEWSRRLGLEVDRGAGVHRVAGRAMARCDTGAAALFARWLAWLLRFREESDAYAGVLAVAEGCEPGPRTVERAFASLWRECSPGMSRQWRERFLAHLTAQRAALLDTGRTRGATARGAVPAARSSSGLRAGSRPDLRAGPPPGSSVPVRPRDRTACGPCLFDVVEPCLGVEVPARLAGDRRWLALTEAAGDVAAWCDGLASGYGRAPAEEVERLVVRMEELWTAARAVPVLVERHGLGLATGRDVTRVACVFLTLSRAHLERLLETRPQEARAQEAQTRESPTGVRR